MFNFEHACLQLAVPRPPDEVLLHESVGAEMLAVVTEGEEAVVGVAGVTVTAKALVPMEKKLPFMIQTEMGADGVVADAVGAGGGMVMESVPVGGSTINTTERAEGACSCFWNAR